MADTTGKQASDLIARIEAEPYAFDFFRALRLVSTRFPDKPRIGESLTPREDPLRFGQEPSISFAPSTLSSFRQEGPHPKLTVNFTGLLGPSGPMPLYFTEYVRDRLRNRHDATLARFLDIFHHRFLSLFYRAWAVNQKAVDMDRPADSRFSVYIGTLGGIGAKGTRERDEVPDNAKRFFAGHLGCQSRHAEGLESIISDFFQLPAKVMTFFGNWLDLPPSSQTRLGESPDTGSLGSSVIVGSRFWECQLRFRLRLGPMSFNDLQRMLPIGSAFSRLKCWILNYCGREFLWDVQLVLRKDDVPATQLGAGGMLGWTTWLASKPFERDVEDVILAGDLENG